MRKDLEEAYIPSCEDCQCNKGPTRKPSGPLHPLPVPDARFDSVAIDFIGPLPLDDGFDTIITMTDRLGADIRIIPSHTTISVEQFALLFLTTGTVKIAYRIISSVIATNFSCQNSGGHSQNSPVSSSRCPQPTTRKRMVRVNTLTKLLIKHSVTMSNVTSEDGSSLATSTFQHPKHNQCIHWIYRLPIENRPLTVFDPPTPATDP